MSQSANHGSIGNIALKLVKFTGDKKAAFFSNWLINLFNKGGFIHARITRN